MTCKYDDGEFGHVHAFLVPTSTRTVLHGKIYRLFQCEHCTYAYWQYEGDA